MENDTARLRTEEYSFLLKGLVDALVELYPEIPMNDDERFFAVLTQTQRVANELSAHIYKLNSERTNVTPLDIVK